MWSIIARLREPARTMAFLAAFTGLRIGELLGLKWADIDFRDSQIDVRRDVVYGVVGKCKSKASKRPVALDRVLADVLLRWRPKAPYSKALAHPSRLLFLSAPTAGMSESGKLLTEMVPRDGVEPPTPAFSGPGRPERMLLLSLVLLVFLAIRITYFLEQ